MDMTNWIDSRIPSKRMFGDGKTFFNFKEKLAEMQFALGKENPTSAMRIVIEDLFKIYELKALVKNKAYLDEYAKTYNSLVFEDEAKIKDIALFKETLIKNYDSQIKREIENCINYSFNPN